MEPCTCSAETHALIKELKESHDEILALIESIKGDLLPTIESLKSSPIFKMLGV